MPARVVGVHAMALAALVAQELGQVLAVRELELEPEPELAAQELAARELAAREPEPAVRELELELVPAGPVLAAREPEPAGQALLPYSTLPMIRKTSRILPSSLSTRKPTASLRKTALAIHCWLQ